MADRQYELVYILPPDTAEQQVTELQSQVDAVVSRMHGQIANTENWGRKRLAYEIGAATLLWSPGMAGWTRTRARCWCARLVARSSRSPRM